MFQSTFSDLRSLILALTLLASFALAAAPPATALEVNKESEEIELLIGDDVIMSWDGLEADTLYRAAVTDEYGQVVSEVLVKSTEGGVLEPFPVWVGSGIVGCDDEGGVPPEVYNFNYPEEAEAALKGRIFELSLQDVATQTSIVRFPMPMEVKPVNVFYFSDFSGCPRCEFDSGERVFLTGTRVMHDSLWLFLVEQFETPPGHGTELEDLYDGPREIWVPGSSFTTLLTSDVPSCLTLDGVIRPSGSGDAETDPDPFWTDVDFVIDPSFCGTDEQSIVPMSIRVRHHDKEPCD